MIDTRKWDAPTVTGTVADCCESAARTTGSNPKMEAKLKFPMCYSFCASTALGVVRSLTRRVDGASVEAMTGCVDGGIVRL